MPAEMAKDAKAKATDSVNDQKASSDSGEANGAVPKADGPTIPPASVEKTTPLKVAMGFFSAPKSWMGIIAMFTFTYQGIKKGERVFAMSMLGIFFFVGIGVAAYFVNKLENSEWRQNLRRRVAEKERAMGITHEDKVRASINMCAPI